MRLLFINLKNQLCKNSSLYILITSVFAFLFIFTAFIFKIMDLEAPDDRYIHFLISIFFFGAVATAFYFIANIYFKNLKLLYKTWKIFGARYEYFLLIMAVDFLLMLIVGCLLGYLADTYLSSILLMDGDNHLYLTGKQLGITLIYEVILACFYFCVIGYKLYKVTKL